jgi:hypothetical protein
MVMITLSAHAEVRVADSAKAIDHYGMNATISENAGRQ